jgi:hypothetical protein
MLSSQILLNQRILTNWCDHYQAVKLSSQGHKYCLANKIKVSRLRWHDVFMCLTAVPAILYQLRAVNCAPGIRLVIN